METQPHIRRPQVLERDVDEVLARRIASDSTFAGRLIDEVERQSKHSLPYKAVQVQRQARHEGAPGSIDLLVRLFGPCLTETGRILIENKLDSSFTPTQPERYASSSVAMSRAGCPAIPLICAPAEYIGKSRYLDPFRARISYESLIAWLEGADLRLIQEAIMRFAMPYEADPVPEVADFHEGYKRLVQQLAPELVVKPNPNPTGARPKDSRTIYFVAAKCLPRWDFLPTLRFSHQCWDLSARRPSVKIMFAGWGIHQEVLRRESAAILENTGFYLRKAGRKLGSLGLVHDTPRMDHMRPVADQVDSVAAGIRAAAALRAWMFANEPTLREWARAVDAARGSASVSVKLPPRG